MPEIKFISYTGKYPALCVGILTLKIDGKIYRFGHTGINIEKYKTDGNYNAFWRSGGECLINNIDDDYEFDIERAPWEIDTESLPDELKPYADELINIFNTNVPYGCCGGCT